MSLTKATYSMIEGAVANVLDFGADPTGVANSTSAILAAIQSIRSNPVQILDTISGSLITVYASGTVYFPKGLYLVTPDQLKIANDIGLSFVGAGSRRTNNAQYGATTLLVSAASTGFAIQAYRSGGRGLTIQDMDVCYNGSFTGSLIDVDDAPGLTVNRCYVGTYGITAGTRQTTAAACIRSTYDEFMTFNNCVFNGAARGWWSDDVRVAFANSFGGSVTGFYACVFYDFAEYHVYHAGNRTRYDVTFINCAFNPITVSPTSTCLAMDNVEGLTLSGCGFGASVSSAPALRWINISNTTGVIQGNTIDDLAPAGILNGMLSVNGNRIFCTDGFTLTGGIISGKSNEFSKGTSGWILAPTISLTVDIGPDLFKSDVTYSYDIPADSANLAGRVNYDSTQDGSVSKFRNTSERVSVLGISDFLTAISTTPYAISIASTGNTILATGASTQAFTLPTPVPGTRLCVSKISAVTLTLTCAATTNYYGVGTSFPTIATLTTTAMGTIELEAYSTIGWVVKSLVGSWTFT